MYRKKKLVIEKKDASTTTNYDTTEPETETNYDTTEYDTNEYYDNYTETTEPKAKSKNPGNRELVYQSIVDANYKKSRYGSKQDNLTLDEIKEKLKGYVSLKSMQDKKVLTVLPMFKTWVRYYNTVTNQFRTGGLLMKVEYPDYIMLVNTANNITWSVQLKDNIIYIPHPNVLKDKLEDQNDRREKRNIEKKTEREKEKQIKDKLYEMYQKGELKKNTR